MKSSESPRIPPPSICELDAGIKKCRQLLNSPSDRTIGAQLFSCAVKPLDCEFPFWDLEMVDGLEVLLLADDLLFLKVRQRWRMFDEDEGIMNKSWHKRL